MIDLPLLTNVSRPGKTAWYLKVSTGNADETKVTAEKRPRRGKMKRVMEITSSQAIHPSLSALVRPSVISMPETLRSKADDNETRTPSNAKGQSKLIVRVETGGGPNGEEL